MLSNLGELRKKKRKCRWGGGSIRVEREREKKMSPGNKGKADNEEMEQ